MPGSSAGTQVPLPMSAAAAGVPVPTYDRSQVSAGIVHVGVGGFHRAHQAMYLDTLMNTGQALDWGICGVGVLPGDIRMAEVMQAQDHLYTLVVKHGDGRLEPRVIGSIVDYLHSPSDPEAVIERMADPATRIVSLTITEGGYNIHAVTGSFVTDAADVLHDLSHPDTPKTVFGLVVEALQRRHNRGIPAFTVLSCDNIQGNGDVARHAFSAFATLRDPDLGTHVREQVAFPNCMVDRITPATTPDDIDDLVGRFGIADRWPVVCEPFTQWVVEDAFGDGRPPLEAAGVQMVGDVEPYELMKLRLLNASHQALAYFGHLAGFRLVHDVAQDSLFATYLLAYMDEEATPTLEAVPGIDLFAYKRQLIERFSNANVRDTVARLCAESSDRIPKWVLPVIRHNLEHDGPIALATAIVASWARYAEAIDEQGEPIAVVDRLAQALTARARTYGTDRLAFIRDEALFGSLADDPRFARTYTAILEHLHSHGARATLTALMAEPGHELPAR